MTDVRADIVGHFDTILRSSKRRDFLKLAGMGGMGIFLPSLVTGCSNDTSTNPSLGATFNMSRATGPLNLIYAYAQFMGDFYARVETPQSAYPGITKWEDSLFTQIVAQKQIQILALKKLIPSGRITDTLLFDFTQVGFATRSGALSFAQTFEDLGVAAINGMGPLFTNGTDLLLASKICSVWARHAATIRDLNFVFGLASSRAHFAGDDVVDPATGLDQSKDPQAVIAEMQPHFETTLWVG